MDPASVILQSLVEYCGSADFESAQLMLLKAGRFGNANLYRLRTLGGDLIIKDFHHCPAWVRWTVARLFVRQEYRALDRLRGLSGIAPEVHRVSPLTVAYPYIDGTPLADMPDRSVPRSFFLKMESLVRGMHRRGMVHLDLRNLGNVIVGRDGQPYLIDFQSALRLPRWLPRRLRRVLFAADLSGIYKGWRRRGAEPIDACRASFLERHDRLRRLWILSGHPIDRLLARLRR